MNRYFKSVVFALHFFFFGVAVVLFFLKFHQSKNKKVFLYAAGALWITFGTIDFIIGVKEDLLSLIPAKS